MLQHYRQLIDDPVRLGAFQRAIASVVKPGDVVADIGCGLGTYAIVAVAREVVRDSGADGVVELMSGYSTALEPPERCDVVIFEDYLTTLVSPGKARVVADLETRWLKPGGRLMPPRARMWLAPPSAWQQTLFPLATPIPVSAGAPIDIALQAAPLGEVLVWRWSVASGGRRADANSLEGTPMRAEALALSRADHVPAAAVELE